MATKDLHASNIITTISEYFLAQRVEPVAAGAEGRDTCLATLADHHAVITAAMKAKQNTSVEFVAALRGALDRLNAHYDALHAQ